MTWTLKGHASVAGPNGGTTGGFDTSGGNLIVIAFACNGGTVTVSDNKGNTYIQLGPASSPQSEDMWYCLNPTVGSGHTFTISGTSQFIAAAVVVWAAPGTPSYQVGSYSTAYASGETVTPSSNDALIVTGVALWDSGNEGITPTISTFTREDGVARASGNNYGGFIADYNQATAAAITPAWSGPGGYGSGLAATETAVFLTSGGGGGSPLFLKTDLNGLGSGGKFFHDRLAS